MKLFFIFLFLFTAAGEIFSQSYTINTVPNPRTLNGGFISDPGKLLDSTSYQSLNQKLIQLEKDTSVEFAIVALPSIGSNVPKEFAVELFNFWGIGKKGKDNGLLLLLVMDQRKWEFETGYGLEGVLTDAFLKGVGEEKLVPNLKQKDYANGFASVINTITDRIKNVPEPETRNTPTETESLPTPDGLEYPFYLTFFGYLLGFTIFNLPILAILYQTGIYYLKKRTGTKYKILYSETLINWKLLLIGFTPILAHHILFYLHYNFFMLRYLAEACYIFTAAFLIPVFIINARELSSTVYNDPYDYYKKINSIFQTWELKLFAVFFPIPSLIYIGWGIYQKHKSRNTVRFCPTCSNEMIRLDEQKDDFFLKEGQKVEEAIGSIDYDVWFCEKTQDVKIYAYEAFFTSYSKCSSCGYKTYHMESDRVVTSPTCTSSGSGIRTYACKNCSHRHSETYTIPARDCTKSSGSSGSSGSSYRSSGSYSSGSSSSSGSFGGGRSGGGGAGGGW